MVNVETTENDSLRVISLLPSATELIAYVIDEHESMGKCANREEPVVELVGISHECDFPEGYTKDAPQLTSSSITFTTSKDVDRQVKEHLSTGSGLYSVDSALLRELQPDVIVTQSLCKVCSVDFCVVEKLASGMRPIPKVVDTNPENLENVLDDVIRIGEALCIPRAARQLRDGLEERIERVASIASARGSNATPRTQVAVLEWTDPIFVGGHWTPQLLNIAGADHPLNPCKEDGQGAGKSITVEVEQLVQCDPGIIIIAPCGLDLERTIEESKASFFSEPWWSGLSAVRHGRVYLVDGNQMFNRPGPRLVDALEWLSSILYDVSLPGVEKFPALRQA